MMGTDWRAILITSCVIVCILLAIFYRVWLVVNRPMPPDMTDADTIRWLDELGRIARSASVLLHDLGVELGAQPLKIFINTAISVLFNPLPWQRVVYRDIKVNQDVYEGVPVSTYTPVTHRSRRQCQGYPTIIYFHGGGWTWLSVGVYDGPLKHFANITRFKIIAVEYRKSPQHPFPASYNDCLSVTKYIIEHTRELSVCKDLIVLAGDGAGGNLAAAVANKMSSLIKLQILINPALQMVNFATPSYQECSDEFLLPGITSPDKEISNWMRYGDINSDLKQVMENNLHISLESYDIFSGYVDSKNRLPVHLNITQKQTIHNLGHNDSVTSQFDRLVLDSRFNPMFTTDLQNVSEVYIITSQYDVLRDEAIMYGQRLQENGVKVTLQHYWHAFHGFFLFAGGGWIELKESQKAMKHLVNYLNTELLGLQTLI
uniref:Alpha/beta hydrolase fold-3 domain-containing protein n=1 Tax=Arion vulgaris TaxID=1028688 RepID=A0A0B6ZXF3_9EUPU